MFEARRTRKNRRGTQGMNGTEKRTRSMLRLMKLRRGLTCLKPSTNHANDIHWIFFEIKYLRLHQTCLKIFENCIDLRKHVTVNELFQTCRVTNNKNNNQLWPIQQRIVWKLVNKKLLHVSKSRKTSAHAITVSLAVCKFIVLLSVSPRNSRIKCLH